MVSVPSVVASPKFEDTVVKRLTCSVVVPVALDLLFLKLREAANVHRLTDSKLVFGSNVITYKRKLC